MTIRDCRNKLEQRKGKRDVLETEVKEGKHAIIAMKKDRRVKEMALEIVKMVALSTQEQLTYNISEITDLALDAVLEKPYSVDLEFVEKRNKTECEIYFSRDGMQIKPYDGGGGAVDIASFALRIAAWSMSRPRSRRTLILDEPFKHLKGEIANKRMLEMVRMITKKLNLQIIMVGDERVSREVITEITDRLFEVTIKKGVSQVSIEK